MLELKEQLLDLNPEALEEIERDCEQKNNNVEEEAQSAKEKSVVPVSKSIKKKNDKKKRRKERLYYDWCTIILTTDLLTLKILPSS